MTTLVDEWREWEAAGERLQPPPMEEHTVPVRFTFVGEESPRIWTDDETRKESA